MMRTALSSALGRAVREELLPRNVAQLTTLPTVHQARRTAWTAAQARTFLRAAADDTAYRCSSWPWSTGYAGARSPD